MRYIIIEKDRGLFLGSAYQMHIFAKENIFNIVKVPSFDSEIKAMSYIAHSFGDDGYEYGVIAVEAKDKYVNIIDIIKQGYGEYTHNLMDLLPMVSESVH